MKHRKPIRRWTMIMVMMMMALSSLSPATASVPAQVTAPTFRNPIKDDSADPWMVSYGGFYYLTYTRGGHISMSKSATIAGLANAPEVVVWRDTSPSRCCNVWAPEMHFINGRWYIYYAADDGNNVNHRMYVIESTSTNPQGSYVFKAKLTPPTDRWAIDGTIFQKTDGSLYFLWAGWPGTVNQQQNIYISPMSNPWTISGERVLLSQPTYAWERMGGPPYVNEGPQILQRNGKIFLTYSASACWTADYKLGMLTNSDGNVLNPASWVKSAVPVFQRSDRNSVYGPAHNSFVKSPDGTEDWLVYHAEGGNVGGCDGDRSTRVQKFTWNADGSPNFGEPVATSTTLAAPSGELARGAPLANGTYKITARNSGKALDVGGCSSTAGADVIIWPWQGGNCQRWNIQYQADGSYKFTAMHSGQVMDVGGCLTSDGADAITWPYSGLECQKWLIEPNLSSAGQRYYRISAKNSGKSLDIGGCSTADGADVLIWPYWSASCQQWIMEPTPVLANGTYKIIARHSGKALDVAGCSTADGADVISWPYTGASCQKWVLARQTDGYYKITALHSGKALDVGGCSTADGANVISWPYTGADCQKWNIEHVADGYFKVTAKNSGKALDVAGCSPADGADVIVWTYSGADCQKWRIQTP